MCLVNLKISSCVFGSLAFLLLSVAHLMSVLVKALWIPCDSVYVKKVKFFYKMRRVGHRAQKVPRKEGRPRAGGSAATQKVSALLFFPSFPPIPSSSCLSLCLASCLLAISWALTLLFLWLLNKIYRCYFHIVRFIAFTYMVDLYV